MLYILTLSLLVILVLVKKNLIETLQNYLITVFNWENIDTQCQVYGSAVNKRDKLTSCEITFYLNLHCLQSLVCPIKN